MPRANQRSTKRKLPTPVVEEDKFDMATLLKKMERKREVVGCISRIRDVIMIMNENQEQLVSELRCICKLAYERDDDDVKE